VSNYLFSSHFLFLPLYSLLLVPFYLLYISISFSLFFMFSSLMFSFSLATVVASNYASKSVWE
jgi:hypothetical protein